MLSQYTSTSTLSDNVVPSVYKETYVFENVNTSIVNGIRRILLSELPHIAMDHTTINNTNTIIQKNTSCLHNEMIINRLALTPLNNTHPLLKIKTFWDQQQQKRVCSFLHPELIPTVHLDVTNSKHLNFNNQDMLSVTPENFVLLYSPETQSEITQKGMNTATVMDDLFVLDTITNEHCLLLYLKPTSSEEDFQRLQLSAKPIVGTGQDYASFSQVGTVQFENIPNVGEEQNRAFQQKVATINAERKTKDLKPLTETQMKTERTIFDTLDAQRVFFSNQFGEPNKIKLTIQSINNKSANQLLFDAIQWYILILKDFNEALKNTGYNSVHPKERDDVQKMEWIQSTTQMKNACELDINHDTHTVGNLLSTFCKILYVDENREEMISKNVPKGILDFVSYNMPHPLHNKIRIRMKLNEEKATEAFKILRPDETPLSHVSHQRNKMCSILLSECVEYIIATYLQPLSNLLQERDGSVKDTQCFQAVEQ